MSGANRKIRRNKMKKKIKEIKGDIAQKISLFDKLGDECLVCARLFNKRSREDITTWSVIVRHKEGVVNLYCPECWQKAQDLLKEINKDLGEKNDN